MDKVFNNISEQIKTTFYNFDVIPDPGNADITASIQLLAKMSRPIDNYPTGCSIGFGDDQWIPSLNSPVITCDYTVATTNTT